jgi:2-polyprenyl-6-methoxyphenol hydroxylase-like FAD-dependent oxidoreductase
LSAALTLERVGIRFDIFEQAEELREVGAGIGLSANAMRVLGNLGLLQRIVDCGTVIKSVVSYTSRGSQLLMMPANLMDVPTVCLHRAELQQTLLAALPSPCVHLGEQFVRLEMTTDGVTAHFASGRTASGDVLIGADGLRSRVRAQLIGDGKPVYRGYQCWRGVCDLPGSELLTETLGQGLRLGVVPIGSRGTAWWCTANEAELASDGPDGAKAKLLYWLGSWHRPIPEVIRATDPTAVIKTGIYDRRPVKNWSRGCCTLLGDAAHPTTPNLGQGGCMAIEDSVVLAHCLSNDSDCAMALRVYEQLRYARTAQVTRMSRYYGVLGQWKNPGAVWLRNIILRAGSGSAATRSYLNFVSYDPYNIALKVHEHT